MLTQAKQTSVPILMYHSIAEDVHARFRRFAVAPACFAEQLEYLAEQQYVTWTVSQLVQQRHSGLPLPDRVVVLTFDDGFADFYWTAWPILKRYGFTATLYLPTAYVNATSRWLQHEGEAQRPLVGWRQVIHLQEQGIEIGAHSHRHLQLDILPTALARLEVIRCKQILEDRLHTEITSFAYPYGYYRSAVQRLVRAAGYTSACAVRYRRSAAEEDVFALSRLIVPGLLTRDQFVVLVQECAAQMNPPVERLRAQLWRYARYGRQAMQHLVKGTENYEASYT